MDLLPTLCITLKCCLLPMLCRRTFSLYNPNGESTRVVDTRPARLLAKAGPGQGGQEREQAEAGIKQRKLVRGLGPPAPPPTGAGAWFAPLRLRVVGATACCAVLVCA